MPPPTTLRSLELLEQLLGGQALTPADLDDLMQNHPEENQHLDFKDGLVMQEVKAARALVRQYVTGFANSTGGTLILGVSEPQRTAAGVRPSRAVSPCARIGGQPLDEWATRLLIDLAGYFSIPPRVQVVTHAQGEVLVVAAARAPMLVPLVENGQLAHYVRLHESTVKAHDWLISDLVLGRRNHPNVEVRVFPQGPAAQYLKVPVEGGGNIYDGAVHSFILDVFNSSLISADFVDSGIVSWSCGSQGRVAPGSLLSFVDAGTSPGVGELPGRPGQPTFNGPAPAWMVRHFPAVRMYNNPQELRPFGEVRTTPAGDALYPLTTEGGAGEITLAAYAIPKGSPPTWFEVVFSIERDGRLRGEAVVMPTPIARPRLRWRHID